MVNGTSRMRARVWASTVLPELVGPTSRMLLLAISTSLFLAPCACRLYWLCTATPLPAPRACHRCAYGYRNATPSGLGRLRRNRAVFHSLVDQPELHRLLGGHVGVALQLALDRVHRLAGMAMVDFVQPPAQVQD